MNLWTTGAIAVMIFFVARLDLGAQGPASGPDSRADWTVTISTSGGFDGQGNGGFSITSAGEFTCTFTTPCTRQIQKPALQSLESFINSAPLPQALQMPGIFLPIPSQTSPSVCLDCIVSTMTLRIRDSKGVEWTYRWSCDVTTQSAAPIDIMRIYRAAAELAK
jgi:hypothetical protein